MNSSSMCKITRHECRELSQDGQAMLQPMMSKKNCSKETLCFGLVLIKYFCGNSLSQSPTTKRACGTDIVSKTKVFISCWCQIDVGSSNTEKICQLNFTTRSSRPPVEHFVISMLQEITAAHKVKYDDNLDTTLKKVPKTASGLI